MKFKLISAKKAAALFLIAGIFFIIGFRSAVPVNNSRISLHNVRITLPPEYISPNQYKMDILFYDINIDLYPEEKMLKGDVLIKGVLAGNKIPHIDLNFYDNMVISSIELNGKPAQYSQVKTRLSVIAGDIQSDTFNIRVKYSGKPVRAGLSAFVFGSINGSSAVYNINEPHYASTWFPCSDIPSDKALARISITNSEEKTSLSNGKLVSVNSGNGRKTFIWETIYPISTYLIAVYSADYENFRDHYVSLDGKDSMNIEYYAFPRHLRQAKKDFEDHPKFLKVFSELFGEYPFLKEKYGIAEFLWQAGAMENQTITGIGSNFVSGNKYFNDILVHELAHSWWGNAVGPATWKDIWLNEGFATYSEALYAEALYGKDALISTMMSKFDENFSGKLYDPGSDLFSSTVYSKGAWVLHMLRWETGDSLFFNILREYYNIYKYSTASTRDFQHLVDSLTGRDFSWFFKQWVYEGEGIIRLDYKWKFDKASSEIILDIRQVQRDYPDYIFTLPVAAVSAEREEVIKIKIDKRKNSYRIPVSFKPNEIIIDPDSRILALYNEIDF